MVEFPIDLGFLPIEKYTKTPIWFASNIWDGKFTPLQAVFFAINLCALSIGLGWSIKHYGYLGTIPIVFHLGYNLTNAAALTSGGRYVAPAEAGLYFYYLLGIYAVLNTLIFGNNDIQSNIKDATPNINKAVIITSILISVFIGFLLPNTDRIIPKAYPVDQGGQLLASLGEPEYQVLSEHGVTQEDILFFLEQPEAEIHLGKALYPQLAMSPINSIKYQFTMRMIKPHYPLNIKLLKPDTTITHFPPVGDAIVIGCLEKPTDFNAGLIISLEEPIIVKSKLFEDMVCTP